MSRMAPEKRLIDVNAIPESATTLSTDGRLYIAWSEIIKAPTVDAVEVVHGRWLPDMEEFDDDPAVGIRGGVFQTGWKCSICGRSEREKEPYCNCGAKMDGGRT